MPVGVCFVCARRVKKEKKQSGQPKVGRNPPKQLNSLSSGEVLGFDSRAIKSSTMVPTAKKAPVASTMEVRLSHARAPPARELCMGPARPLGDPPGTPPPPTCRLTCRQFARDRPQLSATQIHQFLGCLQPRLTADLLVARGFLRVAHARHDVFQPAVRRP